MYDLYTFFHESPKNNQTLQLTTYSPDFSHLTLSELIVCYVHWVLVDSNQKYFLISIKTIHWKEHVCHDRSNHCDISLKYFKLTLLLFPILYYNCQIWAIEHAIVIFLPHKIDFEGRYAINRNFQKAKRRKLLNSRKYSRFWIKKWNKFGARRWIILNS